MNDVGFGWDMGQVWAGAVWGGPRVPWPGAGARHNLRGRLWEAGLRRVGHGINGTVQCGVAATQGWYHACHGIASSMGHAWRMEHGMHVARLGWYGTRAG